jgi:membrane protein implicated in regulation of membrane protease activity
VGIIYLVALIIGLGTIGLQLVMSGDGDADAGHDLSVDAAGDVDAGGDLDHDLSADGHLHVDGAHGHHGADGAGFLPIILSLRFWTFGLMAFGLAGTLLHYFELAPELLVPFVAVAMGLGSGLLASWAFRALARSTTQSGARATDAVGTVGKVLVACEQGSRGKVRIELMGQSIDYLATTDQARIDEGELVLVEEMRDGTAHVSRAPSEFVAAKRQDPE